MLRCDPISTTPKLGGGYFSPTSREASRAAGTYFITDNGKLIGSWRANKGGASEFLQMRTDPTKQSTGVAPGRYMILPKAEDGENFKKGQPAITGLSPGLKPGQPNSSYPEGSALIHYEGMSRGCVTVPQDPAVEKTKELMNQNGGRLKMQIENGSPNRAQPVTDGKGNILNSATGSGTPSTAYNDPSTAASASANSVEPDGTNLTNDGGPPSAGHVGGAMAP